jgi:hypothetical protein
MDESYYNFTVRIPKPSKRWFRFSLLSLLILVTGICLVLGLWPRHGDGWHTIQLQNTRAEDMAEVIEEVFVNKPAGDLFQNWPFYSKSKDVPENDGSKLAVEVDVDTNSIRILATEAELKKIEELLQKLGEGPNPPAPQREPSPESKFRLLSHRRA